MRTRNYALEFSLMVREGVLPLQTIIATTWSMMLNDRLPGAVLLMLDDRTVSPTVVEDVAGMMPAEVNASTVEPIVTLLTDRLGLE